MIADNSCGNLAAVEDFCASDGDLFKGVGEVALVQDLTGPQGPTPRCEYGPRGRVFTQELVGSDIPRQLPAHRKAVSGETYRRSQDVSHGQVSVLLVGREPCVEEAGNRDGQDAFFGNAGVGVAFPGCRKGRGARAIGNLDLTEVPSVDHDEPIAPYAGHLGFHHVDSGGHGYGSVDCVAALLQDGDACLGGQRMPGGDHAVAAHDVGPVGRKLDAVR